MDITRWVSGNEARLAPPTKLSIDVLQSAIASTFANEPRVAAMARPHGDDIEGLTARQLQVLKAIGQGKSNVEISQDLSCSLNTVKRHVTAVLQKLKVPNRTRAAMLINHMEKS
jgi:DNA-binding NarL/FixJ family response regulator